MANRKGAVRRAPSSTERGRRPSGVEDRRGGAGRWSAQRKMEVVLRILKGEELDVLSRELRVTPARLAEWRDNFLDGGQAALKSRQPDHRDEEATRLKAKIGELAMENELLYEKVDRLEAGLRPPSRRPRG